MQTGFDPLASFIAILALWVTLREIRRSNRHLFRVVKCQTSYSQSVRENRIQPFYSFSVTLKNIGLEASDVRVALSIQTNTRIGRLILDMPHVTPGEEPRKTKANFGRGSRATFALKSYNLGNDQFVTRGFESLRRPMRLNRVRIVISQDGFELASIRVGSLTDWLCSLWNPLACKFNRLFWRDITIEGEKMMSCPNVLPRLPCLEDEVRQFIDGVLADRRRQVRTAA